MLGQLQPACVSLQRLIPSSLIEAHWWGSLSQCLCYAVTIFTTLPKANTNMPWSILYEYTHIYHYNAFSRNAYASNMTPGTWLLNSGSRHGINHRQYQMPRLYSRMQLWRGPLLNGIEDITALTEAELESEFGAKKDTSPWRPNHGVSLVESLGENQPRYNRTALYIKHTIHTMDLAFDWCIWVQPLDDEAFKCWFFFFFLRKHKNISAI